MPQCSIRMTVVSPSLSEVVLRWSYTGRVSVPAPPPTPSLLSNWKGELAAPLQRSAASFPYHRHTPVAHPLSTRPSPRPLQHVPDPLPFALLCRSHAFRVASVCAHVLFSLCSPFLNMHSMCCCHGRVAVVLMRCGVRTDNIIDISIRSSVHTHQTRSHGHSRIRRLSSFVCLSVCRCLFSVFTFRLDFKVSFFASSLPLLTYTASPHSTHTHTHLPTTTTTPTLRFSLLRPYAKLVATSAIL